MDKTVEKEIRIFGREIASRGLGLVYGGSSRGLMGALADEVLAAGGGVIGVIPRALEGREAAHRGLTELKIVGTMHEREQMLFELADAFVAFPGGFGTLQEIIEMLTWKQLGIHGKPIGSPTSKATSTRSCAVRPRDPQEIRPPRTASSP